MHLLLLVLIVEIYKVGHGWLAKLDEVLCALAALHNLLLTVAYTNSLHQSILEPHPVAVLPITELCVAPPGEVVP